MDKRILILLVLIFLILTFILSMPGITNNNLSNESKESILDWNYRFLEAWIGFITLAFIVLGFFGWNNIKENFREMRDGIKKEIKTEYLPQIKSEMTGDILKVSQAEIGDILDRLNVIDGKLKIHDGFLIKGMNENKIIRKRR